MSQPGSSIAASNVAASVPQGSNGWVLLVVQSGGNYYLAQVNVHNLTSNDFFVKLRSEYFRLRGSLTCFFSVWGFSHCEFYKFEKFDEHAVTPRKKDEWPDPKYDYYPKDIVEMPPITEHEFNKRFYSCAPKFHILCHKNCHCFKIQKQAHNREIINLLPKKLSQFDDQSDQRDLFWGLYARQQPLFWRVGVYNALCISPLVWFFFMWIFHWGHDGDMQNASVPLMIMMSLLSVFWATFMASLKSFSSS
ncbi:hypothetical protein K458DRAFT_314529 [Lentithecium fluviatile CBS 122367]|uniref:Uncharacterized protein n=1 Tax=Lentithecium fluviatile CBS 122367 TaxID=1168545 RepID=A0A6G1IM64_9PLEO|nr:hypothetical protein K458DRAFT_314529 [Lentithecium fluviatile CBS 122367]